MPCIPPSYLSLSPVGSHAPFFRRCSRKWDGREGGCERQTRRAQRQPPLRVRVRRSFLPRRMDGLTELETFEATATEGRRERLLLFAAVATVEGGAKSRPQRRRPAEQTAATSAIGSIEMTNRWRGSRRRPILIDPSLPPSGLFLPRLNQNACSRR